MDSQLKKGGIKVEINPPLWQLPTYRPGIHDLHALGHSWLKRKYIPSFFELNNNNNNIYTRWATATRIKPDILDNG
ncbi:hypothetical protein FRACYDRAFT_271116 [Fragilariopsis cylindrus CCMP1102]|uniref:Uncharacterized protein n=1 Tax=Fragilariopsis cylindrus CCMP1102 TaxID=635003 RepID=A0A1E7EWF7_9STRA|nr:hypothetical protein FRACYDRAFT_271116 [Fragilariopsis cylindrus CCMP1102]|eukprot:OEU10368.1 hypothetical protein FRACYDRAFT_271116 [Fragilariopsis cylindrus CCMP1102]